MSDYSRLLHRRDFLTLAPMAAAAVYLPGKLLAGDRARIAFDGAAILVDDAEPSYVRYGAAELGAYLEEITGNSVPVGESVAEGAKLLIVAGGKAAGRLSPGLPDETVLGEEGFILRSGTSRGRQTVVVAGARPQGTNCGLARLMRMIRAEGKCAYVDGPLEIQCKPSFARRGIHLNGWPATYPYGFRSWPERDWKRFIDIYWVQGVNLFLLWPFMEIMPVPLSAEDGAYLQEVRRVVEYAQEQRGMEVWILHSANRIGISDCGERDSRLRTYWVRGGQQDMNPADPAQFARIMQSFEALYRSVNNANGYVMIDSDPGGWPQSPLGEQVKILKGARALLDRYNLKKGQAKLIDWMWKGWGRHKFPHSADSAVEMTDWSARNPDASDIAFMEESIRAFRKGLPEPWSLLAGRSAYLEASQEEGVLAKTIYLPYGYVEGEPNFPSTIVDLDLVRRALDAVRGYDRVEGVMGNNANPILQLPMTNYFLSSLWDFSYLEKGQREVLADISRYLYPESESLVADCFVALGETDGQKIAAVLARLEVSIATGKLGRPGVIGRKLLVDELSVARDLVAQLQIRSARERLFDALRSPWIDRQQAQSMVENWFDLLLAWNLRTGWQKMVDIDVWRLSFFGKPTNDRGLREAVISLKRVSGRGPGVTTYDDIVSFLEPIARKLCLKYDENSVMIGCIEPMKIAVIESP